MRKFILVKNEELKPMALFDIIALKQQYWNYSYDSQIMWLRKNLRNDDIHILFYDDVKLIAYLNLVNLSVIFDDVKMNMIGVGNVCVSQDMRRQKIGYELMKYTNNVIKDFNKEGILLCHEELIPFYKNAGWNELLNAQVKINGEPYDQRIMYLSDTYFACKMLNIDRLF